MLALALITAQTLTAEEFKLTAYCSCEKCCGKSDGIMANGQKAEYGYVACNWLPFGTILHIDGYGMFVVGDRGAESEFGSKKNKIKHLDIYMPTHSAAKQFGVMYKNVEIIGEQYKFTPDTFTVMTPIHKMIIARPFNREKND